MALHLLADEFLHSVVDDVQAFVYAMGDLAQYLYIDNSAGDARDDARDDDANDDDVRDDARDDARDVRDDDVPRMMMMLI